MFKSKYKYPKLVQESRDGSRFYSSADYTTPLPSVTTILSATKDMTVLDNWRKRVGDAEADRIVNESTNIGNHLHANLERYILGDDERTGPIISKILTKLVIKEGLSNVSEVWGVETPVYSKDMYAGTADAVGIHGGKETLIDFKNSKRRKKAEWLCDYKSQVTAYALAHNEMHGTNIRKGVIMIGVRNGTYQECVIEGRAFDKQVDIWYEKVYSYHENNKT